MIPQRGQLYPCRGLFTTTFKGLTHDDRKSFETRRYIQTEISGSVWVCLYDLRLDLLMLEGPKVERRRACKVLGSQADTLVEYVANCTYHRYRV